MTFPFSVRRAALLGLSLGATACDVVDFASNPAPRFEQTWNVPATNSRISVAELLPNDNSVQILPDSSAFALTIAATSIARRVGNDCGLCVTRNGTFDQKPQFVLNAGNSTPLPTNVVSAAVLDGSISVQLTNNMSFDPLYVNTAPGAVTQGFMLIVVRSGSLVLGRDSVRGAASVSADGKNRPFAPGGIMTRIIDIGTGTAATGLTFDVTLNSPVGDHNEFINADGTLNAIASVPSLIVASVGLNVPSQQTTSSTDTLDLELEESLTDHVVRGALELTITNPFAITGNISVNFAYGALPTEVISKVVALPAGNGVRTVTLDSTEMNRILTNTVELTVGGALSSVGPITVTPRQAISISNRLILTIRTGGGN